MENNASELDSIEIRKHNIQKLWFISDRWFRILEFSLILATLHYFKDKASGVLVAAIYWVSWAVFYMWVLEMGEFIAVKINYSGQLNKNKRYFVWLLSMALVIGLYLLITTAINSVVDAK